MANWYDCFPQLWEFFHSLLQYGFIAEALEDPRSQLRTGPRLLGELRQPFVRFAGVDDKPGV